MPVNYKITWSSIEEDCNKLADKIKECDCIVALGRGGLVPGVILSYKLKSYVFNFGVKRYKEDNTPGDLWIIQPPGDWLIKNYKDKSIIVLDDLSDRGNTLQQVKAFFDMHNFSNVRYATLYIKTSTKFMPNFFIKEFDDNIWLDFPWESI